ncbi:MAG: STAS domain-containing protein [Chlamydiota bacterium]
MSVVLNVRIEEKKGTQLVHIEGRLDAANAPKLELKLNKLVKEGSDQIVLDFAKVDYLSSAGIRLLLSMTKRLAPNRGLKLCAMREDVIEIIKMAGFERILEIYDTEKEALQAFT